MGRIDREPGRLRGKARKLVVALALLALLAVPVTYVVASDTFTDVPTNAFYHNSVNAVANAGITVGCNSAGTRYCPGDPVTRGQMAVFLDKLGNLSGGSGPVTDALTVLGQAVVGFEEPFTLAGGAAFECETTDAVPFVFGEYTVQHQLIDIAPTVPADDIPTHEVIVTLEDDPDVEDSDYQVCFHRLSGTLPAGVYDTYGTGFLFIGSGIFAGEAQADAKIGQFRQAKAN